MDASVKITSTKTVTGFDPVTLLPSRQVQVTFTVGEHGPFVIVTPADHFTTEYLDRETQKYVDTLRSAGALGSLHA